MELSAVSHLGSSPAAGRQKAALDGVEKSQAGQALPVPEAPIRPQLDRYEKTGGEDPSPGIYSVEPDGSEGYQIAFRAPEDGEARPDAALPERTTVNTDKVDQELRRLEEEQAALERQLAETEQAGGDAPQASALRRRLNAVASELTRKDTDAYRRSHASVTTE